MYAARTDIINIYSEDILFAVTDENGVVDDAKIDNAITSASAEIDSYLGTRYTLPLASVPPRLVEICVDIAIYRFSPSADVLTEEIEKRYKGAIAWLKDVGAGRASLGLPSATGKTSARPVTTSGPDRLFTRKNMRGL